MGTHQQILMDYHPGSWDIFSSLQRCSLQIQIGNALVLHTCNLFSLAANFACDGNQAINYLAQYFL